MEPYAELIKKFNLRLDVVIKANPEQDFVIPKEQQTLENLQMKLNQLKGTKNPLQNVAVAYLKNHILDLRADETEKHSEISQVENLILIFEKLQERKKQLDMEQLREQEQAQQQVVDKDMNLLLNKQSHNKNEIAMENQTETKNAKEFYQTYQINSETALSHNDLYAFVNQMGNYKVEDINKLLEGFGIAPELKSFKKEDVLSAVIYPIKEAGIEEAFKKTMEAELEKKAENKSQISNKYSEDEIKDFYQKYEIKTDTPLSHTDLYAFLKQTKDNSLEAVNQILNKFGLSPIENLKKNELLFKVVYPIKENGKEKDFKETLNQILQQDQQKVHQEEKKTEKPEKKTYSAEEIKEFYQKYQFKENEPLTHTDVYAFIYKYGNEANRKINSIAGNILGKEISLGEYTKKNTVLAEVVYPIKAAGAEKQFKEALKESLGFKVEKRQESQLTMAELDELLLLDNAKDILYDAGVQKGMIESFNINAQITKADLGTESMIFKKEMFLVGTKPSTLETLKNELQKQLKQSNAIKM